MYFFYWNWLKLRNLWYFFVTRKYGIWWCELQKAQEGARYLKIIIICMLLRFYMVENKLKKIFPKFQVSNLTLTRAAKRLKFLMGKTWGFMNLVRSILNSSQTICSKNLKLYRLKLHKCSYHVNFFQIFNCYSFRDLAW